MSSEEDATRGAAAIAVEKYQAALYLRADLILQSACRERSCTLLSVYVQS
jgi:hypothetical protein